MRRLLAALLAAGALFAAPAQAQDQDPSLLCDFQLATAGGQALTCPQGGIRNVVDIEGGTEVYVNGRLDRGKLRLNLSAGEAAGVREAIALNPDVGGCTLIYDGRKTMLASFCPRVLSPPGIRFYQPPLLCTPRNCAPLALARTVARLRQRVHRLRVAVRTLRRYTVLHTHHRPAGGVTRPRGIGH